MALGAAANQNRPPPAKLAENIMHFARVLREAGIPVGPGSVLDALDAALAGPLHRREDFYWTLHSVFVKRHEQSEFFDQAFHMFWKKPKLLQRLMQLMLHEVASKSSEGRKQAGHQRLTQALSDKATLQSRRGRKSEALDLDAQFTASTQEQLRTKDFEQMTVAEQSAAMAALRQLRIARSEAPTRRFQASHAGRHIDLRRTFRSIIRDGGQIAELARRQRRWREPPLVVLCDISGSCSNYTRLFLHFLHRLINDRARVHVFLFGTRLTNVTRELHRRDVDDALVKVSAAVKDWSGGTRIGQSLHEFNYTWARRVLGQGAQVLLMTDGLDRDDITQLAAEMRRLRLSAKRVIWLNPLLRFEGFEARAGGIRAMMPHVDEFRPVHSLNSLADLAAALAKPAGNTHDPRKWIKTAQGRAA
jgi:uncharacterized protein with von Willebrand factor type A (vWA) domain